MSVFLNILNESSVTFVPDLSAYGWDEVGPGWEAISPMGEVLPFDTYAEAHAWRLSMVRYAVAMTGDVVMCGCEHVAHFEGGAHAYLGAPAGDTSSVYVGRVCDSCVGGHGYLIAGAVA